MKRIRKWYAGFKWRDRILSFALLQAVFLTVSFSLGYDLITTAITVTAISATLHFIFSKAKFPAPAIIMILQTIALTFTFVVYAFLGEPIFGDSTYVFAVLLLSVSTVLLFVLAYKFSVGRLWLTLLVSYVGMDALGPFLMHTFGIANPFAGVAVGFFILGARCVLWRDFFRNRKVEIPEGIKNQKNTESVKTLLESIEGVTVTNIAQDAIDFKVDTPINTYYVNALALNQRIVVTSEDVASGIYHLKPTLFKTAWDSVRLNKSVKRKSRKNVVPCIVNTTDKSNSKTQVNVSLTGKTRDAGKDVIILSPSSLVNLIKKDVVKA